MGSVLSSAAKAVTSIPGSIVGGVARGTADAAGATSDYYGNNPYGYGYLLDAVQRQNDIYRNQDTLAKQLAAIMQGKGPNPAQTQYMANAQNNIANAQGLIASQRGINPGLATRLAANTAAKQNQEAALGSALLQQQQQLGATSALGNLYGQMDEGNQAQQRLYNQANLGQMNINADTASSNARTRGQLAGGLFNALGGLAKGAAAAAKGGRVPGHAKVDGDSYENDTVHVKLSPGEIVIPRSKANDAKKAKEFIDHLMASEEKDNVDFGAVVAARRKKRAS